MKRILFEPEVPGQVRAFPQHVAMTILEAIHRVFFKETIDTVNIHRILDRKDAYR